MIFRLTVAAALVVSTCYCSVFGNSGRHGEDRVPFVYSYETAVEATPADVPIKCDREVEEGKKIENLMYSKFYNLFHGVLASHKKSHKWLENKKGAFESVRKLKKTVDRVWSDDANFDNHLEYFDNLLLVRIPTSNEAIMQFKREYMGSLLNEEWSRETTGLIDGRVRANYQLIFWNKLIDELVTLREKCLKQSSKISTK